MSSESPKMERIKLKDLPAMAARFIDGAKPGTFIPITKHRAQAMAHNPNADPEGVAMLLATVGERCVGYFGVMAVMLQHEGKLHKVHWLTTWAVAPDFIGRGLGSRLMEEALALDVDLAIVGSKPARRVSTKYGFQEVKPLDYVQIDFGVAGRYNPISLLMRGVRKLFSLVGIRFRIEPISEPIESFFEILFGPFVRPFLFQSAVGNMRRRLPGLDGRVVKKLERVALSSAVGKAQFFRDIEVINWMLAEPWVVSQSRSQSVKLNYVFSDWRRGFEYLAMKVDSPNGGKSGFVCLQRSFVRTKPVMKVLDYKLADGYDSFQLGIALLLDQTYSRGRGIIEGPLDLAEVIPVWMRSLVVIRKQRTLQVHPRAADSPLGRGWQQLEQTYVDGDTAFT
jgi:GNAT superfamily N-acetyltransferase